MVEYNKTTMQIEIEFKDYFPCRSTQLYINNLEVNATDIIPAKNPSQLELKLK